MKVTVFNGSPRGKKSNSHQIISPLLEGAKEAGAETREVFLIEHDIKHCRGCFVCWGETPGTCAINDDMTDLLKLYLESDYIGLATPVYRMYMTGLLKNFTDRFLPLSTPHIRKNEDGSFYHDGRINTSPRQFLITNSGFPGEDNFHIFKAMMASQNLVLEVYRDCGEALSSPEIKDPMTKKRIIDFFNALKKAGWEMVKDGEVSPETVEQIHMEIMSHEEYMAQANRFWDEKIEKTQQD